MTALVFLTRHLAVFHPICPAPSQETRNLTKSLLRLMVWVWARSGLGSGLDYYYSASSTAAQADSFLRDLSFLCSLCCLFNSQRIYHANAMVGALPCFMLEQAGIHSLCHACQPSLV